MEKIHYDFSALGTCVITHYPSFLTFTKGQVVKSHVVLKFCMITGALHPFHSKHAFTNNKALYS